MCFSLIVLTNLFAVISSLATMNFEYFLLLNISVYAVISSVLVMIIYEGSCFQSGSVITTVDESPKHTRLIALPFLCGCFSLLFASDSKIFSSHDILLRDLHKIKVQVLFSSVSAFSILWI